MPSFTTPILKKTGKKEPRFRDNPKGDGPGKGPPASPRGACAPSVVPAQEDHPGGDGEADERQNDPGERRALPARKLSPVDGQKADDSQDEADQAEKNPGA